MTGDRVMALVAVLVLAGFLGILVFMVGRIDLGIVAAITLLLVIVDFAWLFRNRGD